MAENVQVELELVGVDNASAPVDQAGESLRDYSKKAEEAGKTSKKAAEQSTASWTEFRSMYSTVVEVGQVALQMWNETAGATVNLANEVRALRDVTGASSEEASRLVDVLGHYKVGVSAAEMATKKLAKEGLEFNIETLANLSDQYLKLNSDQERTNFLFETFGKSGTDFAEIMLSGADAIREMNEEVPKQLILTDKQIQAARDYEIAMDELNDTLMANKVIIGNQLIPVVTTLLNLYKRTNETIDEGENTYRRGALYASAIAIQQENLAERTREADSARWTGLASLYATEEASLEVADAIMEMGNANREFLSTLGQVQSGANSYAREYEKINSDIKLSDEERQQKLKELADEYELQNRKIVLGLLERKLMEDGMLTDDELNWLLEKGQAWGIYSQSVIDDTRAAMNEVNLLAETINMLPTQREIHIRINTYGNLGAVGDIIPAGARASGGMVDAGKPYLVGERGAELFVPQTAGNVVSNTNLMDSSAIVAAIERNRLDEDSLTRALTNAMLRTER